jgi:hypothetical protein
MTDEQEPELVREWSTEKHEKFLEAVRLGNVRRADLFARELIETMTIEERASMEGKPRPNFFLLHFGVGMEVRNRLNMWERCWPLCVDSLSVATIERAWEILNEVNPEPVD